MRKPGFVLTLVASAVGSLAVVVALGSGAACSFSHDAEAPDTFVPEQDSVADNGLQLQPIIAFDPVTSTEVPADVDSCKGIAYDAGLPTDAAFDAGADGAAPGGEMIPVDLVMYQFGSGNTEPIPGVGVDIFFSDRINGVSPDLPGLVADDKGVVHMTAPAGWRVAYRIAEKSDPDLAKAQKAFGNYDLQLPWVPGGQVAGNGVSGQEYQTLNLAITATSGYTPPPGSAILAARIVDCQRRNISNTTVELFDIDTGANVAFGAGDACKNHVPCRIYMGDTELPNFSLAWTSHSALVVMPNLDTGHHYVVRARGKREGSASLEEIGERGVELQPDTIDVAYVYP